MPARTAWAALVGLTYGHVAYQLAGHMSGASPGSGGIDAAAFPHVAAMASGPAFDWDRAFERALDAVVDGFTGLTPHDGRGLGPARPGTAR